MISNSRARFIKHFSRAMGLTVLVLVTLILMLPIITLVVTSLKLDTEYNQYPIVFFPEKPQWVNYTTVLQLPRFINSIFCITFMIILKLNDAVGQLSITPRNN